jgi:hypothetical protein
MSQTRASIDRKLDRLSSRTRAAKQRAIRRSLPVIAFTIAAVVTMWWRRRARSAHAGFVNLERRNLWSS